jgi:hypothetical protein
VLLYWLRADAEEERILPAVRMTGMQGLSRVDTFTVADY